MSTENSVTEPLPVIFEAPGVNLNHDEPSNEDLIDSEERPRSLRSTDLSFGSAGSEDMIKPNKRSSLESVKSWAKGAITGLLTQNSGTLEVAAGSESNEARKLLKEDIGRRKTGSRRRSSAKLTPQLSKSNLPVCIICMENETSKKPFIFLPCVRKCNIDAPVHGKCIYQWKQQLDAKGRAQQKGCPLCRAPLHNVSYTPPNYLDLRTLSEHQRLRERFALEPVRKEIGMLRAYVKVRHSGTFDAPMSYEFYVQPVLKSAVYPAGPIPDGEFPVKPKEKEEPDLLLLRGEKLKKEGWYDYFTGSSRVRIFSEDDNGGENLLGVVEAASKWGLEYVFHAVASTSKRKGNMQEHDDIHQQRKVGGKKIFTTPTKSKVVGVNRNGEKSSSNWFTDCLRPESDELEGSSLTYVDKRKKEMTDMGCVGYLQNRFGANSGPRQMRILLPGVNQANLPGVPAPLDDDDADQEDSDFESDVSSCSASTNEESCYIKQRQNLSNYRHLPLKKGTLLKQLHETGKNSFGNITKELLATNKAFFFRNKAPIWVESLEAYSLDFNGRVTLPSNKNFQLQGTTPKLFERQEVMLQFGKVSEFDDKEKSRRDDPKYSVYTLDFQWPFSPIQAFSICISSCDRKLACA
eukprot:snap_masked-scaffold_145-processed-gene-0.1-mRNA-1 protein AED:0.42 eAED:0.45 QI:0/-1/0/1/-1/1/1/0/632